MLQEVITTAKACGETKLWFNGGPSPTGYNLQYAYTDGWTGYESNDAVFSMAGAYAPSNLRDFLMESEVQHRVPRRIVASRLRVRVSVAPLTPNGYTFTLRRNGVDTALKATILGLATEGSSDVQVKLLAGDLINWKADTIVDPDIHEWASLTWEERGY